MCGLSAVIAPSLDAGAIADALRRMHGALAHRGPDGEGWLWVWLDRLADTAFRLLKIQHPDPRAAQPMGSADRRHRVGALVSSGIAAFAEQLQASGVPFVEDVHETAWNTREFVIHDDRGHTLHFGEGL